MKSIEKLKQFEISREKSESIIGGVDWHKGTCLAIMAVANEIIDSGFYRCLGGCPKEDVLEEANRCAGRAPWSMEKF
ncbi:hypothetical protein [Tenacibaculum amylolyticum]|uniref:hypothetical protein n=1 Tax=Tenacibaculum amylolyticum TaxID=104269 RepID=UPI0038937DA4